MAFRDGNVLGRGDRKRQNQWRWTDGVGLVQTEISTIRRIVITFCTCSHQSVNLNDFGNPFTFYRHPPLDWQRNIFKTVGWVAMKFGL